METRRLAERREVLYAGRVQGVGFRYTVRSIAGHHEITGYVKNLSDGRVQLVVEGPTAEMDAFLREVQIELGNYIRDVAATTMPATGAFGDFEVRY